jgi:hypothetical protein
MPKSVFTRRIASSRRALKKQFAGNRKDSSDPAQTTAGEESGSHYSRLRKSMGNSERKGKKEKMGSGIQWR